MWQPLAPLGHTLNQHQTHWTVTVLKLGLTTFCLSSFSKITAPRVQTLTGQRRSEPQAITPQLGWRRKRFNKKTLANLCHLPSRKGLHHKSLDFVGPSLLWHPQHGVFEDLQDNLLPLMVQNNRILGVSSLVPRSSESRSTRWDAPPNSTKFVTTCSVFFPVTGSSGWGGMLSFLGEARSEHIWRWKLHLSTPCWSRRYLSILACARLLGGRV